MARHWFSTNRPVCRLSVRALAAPVWRTAQASCGWASRGRRSVHRLDTDTSGCLLFARNPGALKRFNAAFEARAVEKVYLGIVAGPVAEDEGTISLSLSKISSAEKGWRMIAAKRASPP